MAVAPAVVGMAAVVAAEGLLATAVVAVPAMGESLAELMVAAAQAVAVVALREVASSGEGVGRLQSHRCL